jgi:hypothetical protein
MKTLNVELVKELIANDKYGKWKRNDYEYALSGMYTYYTEWSLKRLPEIKELFFERILTHFHLIQNYVCFRDHNCYLPEVVQESDITPELHETIEFNSPINREYPCVPTMDRFIDDTRSTIEVVTNSDGTGWFEWDIEELELTEGGELEFEGNRLVGYDGLFELPVQLMDFLDSKGFITEDCR